MWARLGMFSRGVASAIGLLGAAEFVFPAYGALDIMAGVHAVIVGWNTLAGYIGALVGPLIGFPEVPPEIMNVLVIGTAIGPAWAYSILKSEWGMHKGFVQNGAFWVRAICALLDPYISGMLAITADPSSMLFWVGIFGIALPMITAMRRLQAYRSGILWALGSLALLEGAYLISTDKTKEAIAGFVCAHQSAGAPMCAPDTPTP